ncbi:peptidylprolyl isomerase [Arcobacter caeni]|uniref:Peptidylprolyl isomerase n=1 Tax=Arcobacter caeni TaxID=1912877 RepID=A0A363D3E4_9BACT|nr:peptidylprolyl isomerase [Arcobacter caeni]PUE65793.1 peptidylprolyl isomerase [Arcobacter caeni]
MYKLFLTLLVSSGISFAGIVNGVALTVNDEPITTYDIDKTVSINKISKNEAVGLLIDKALYEQAVTQNNISADIFDINEYIERLAKANGMDLYSFKAMVKQRYPNYADFEEEAKDAVIRQKLIQKIVKGQLAVATQEDMELYYEKNKNQFSTSKVYEVTQYASKNKASLTNAINNPMVIAADVEKTPLKLGVQSLQPQMQFLLNDTKLNTFTPIFTANKQYVSLFVIRKEGTTSLDFETVKAKIFNDMMSLREKKYLKDYFEKQKLTADIKIVR